MHDPVLTALSRVGEIMLPVAFAGANGNRPEIEAMAALTVYNLRESAEVATAVDAIRDDRDLAPLIGDGAGVFLRQNTGRGWRVEATSLPGVLVQNAARVVVAAGGATDSLAPLVEELRRLLPRVRRLVAGEPDQTPVLAGFYGIALADGVEIETPWGTLRGASEFERSMRPFGNPAVSLILETAIPVTWSLGEGNVEISPALASATAATRLIELASVLALGREHVARWTWQTVFGALDFGRGFQGPGNPVSPWPHWMDPPPPEPLTNEQVTELPRWISMVAERYDDSIAVASRRLLSAASERSSSPEDALIDAVISWENLFGKGSKSEMTFRITTALSILLESEPDKRPDRRTALAKIYGLRSKVVHGGAQSAKDNLPERKDEAIDVAIAALRTLLEEHPALLRDADRGMKLILGLY